MADPRIRENLESDLRKLTMQITAHEDYIEELTVEIARRKENNGNVEVEMAELARVEAQLRTHKLLKGAKTAEMQGGQNMAGAFLGENIGKQK